MPEKAPQHRGMFWGTLPARERKHHIDGEITGEPNGRVWMRAVHDMLLVPRHDGTLVVTSGWKVMVKERCNILKNRLKKALREQ